MARVLATNETLIFSLEKRTCLQFITNKIICHVLYLDGNKLMDNYHTTLSLKISLCKLDFGSLFDDFSESLA